jgi:hypothetical protein
MCHFVPAIIHARSFSTSKARTSPLHLYCVGVTLNPIKQTNIRKQKQNAGTLLITKHFTHAVVFRINVYSCISNHYLFVHVCLNWIYYNYKIVKWRIRLTRLRHIWMQVWFMGPAKRKSIPSGHLLVVNMPSPTFLPFVQFPSDLFKLRFETILANYIYHFWTCLSELTTVCDIRQNLVLIPEGFEPTSVMLIGRRH